jgi:hypothetical protein
LTVAEIFQFAKLSPKGPLPFGEGKTEDPPERMPGVYVIARVGSPMEACKANSPLREFPKSTLSMKARGGSHASPSSMSAKRIGPYESVLANFAGRSADREVPITVATSSNCFGASFGFTGRLWTTRSVPSSICCAASSGARESCRSETSIKEQIKSESELWINPRSPLGIVSAPDRGKVV